MKRLSYLLSAALLVFTVAITGCGSDDGDDLSPTDAAGNNFAGTWTVDGSQANQVTFDGNAMYRHKDLQGLRDESEENPIELEASKFGLNYIKLDGNVGCMVNGAGLAMATMDIIKLSGGDPANFLDVGGGANVETVKNGFRIILEDQNVKAILINIFGGIVRCDRVANGVIEAVKDPEIAKKVENVPIIVRLQGTNAEEAKEIIDNSDLNVISAVLLKEAAEEVSKVLAA